jgi:hypothetical protein
VGVGVAIVGGSGIGPPGGIGDPGLLGSVGSLRSSSGSSDFSGSSASSNSSSNGSDFCVVRMVLDLILSIFLVRLRIILLKGLIQTQKLGH